MNDSTRKKEAVTYYSTDGLKDNMCCICGEKLPNYEFRGRGVCSYCIEFIRTKG